MNLSFLEYHYHEIHYLAPMSKHTNYMLICMIADCKTRKEFILDYISHIETLGCQDKYKEKIIRLNKHYEDISRLLTELCVELGLRYIRNSFDAYD